MNRQAAYDQLFRTLDALFAGETDHISIMATVSCELFHQFDHVHWVGFYRNTGGEVLKLGPYQGGHGCLTISFDQGVCGQCAREKRLLNIPDVNAIPHHIACSGSTRSEIVVPMLSTDEELLFVLDLDSDLSAAFDEVDELRLAQLNRYFLNSG